MPHTISLAIIYRSRINSFYELPEDKRPPRNLWDKPTRLSDFFEDVFETNKGAGNRNERFIEFNNEDVE